MDRTPYLQAISQLDSQATKPTKPAHPATPNQPASQSAQPHQTTLPASPPRRVCVVTSLCSVLFRHLHLMFPYI